jgi:hypothetical protein
MFSTTPPAMPKARFTPIVRPNPGTNARVLITGEVKWAMTHFVKNRTFPCTHFCCPLCSRSIPRRLYAFLPCLLPNHVSAVLQLTAQAYSQLENQFRPFADQPTGVATVSRSGKAKNSPLKVTWKEPTQEHLDLAKNAPELDVQAEMLRIWGLPARNGESSDKEYSCKIAAIIEDALHA